ncbi:MAG TPA: hypothetical protein VHF22_10415 [Planctomycetota bacterium]|nr:hypothetical protein [Planctomycetota bacterium]
MVALVLAGLAGLAGCCGTGDARPGHRRGPFTSSDVAKLAIYARTGKQIAQLKNEQQIAFNVTSPQEIDRLVGEIDFNRREEAKSTSG